MTPELRELRQQIARLEGHKLLAIQIRTNDNFYEHRCADAAYLFPDQDPAWLLAKWKWLHRQGYEMRTTGKEFRFVAPTHADVRLTWQPTEELAIAHAYVAVKGKEQG